MGFIVAPGLRGNNHKVCIDTVGYIGLLTIEYPVITLFFRPTAHTGQITSGIWLGHRNSKDILSTGTFRQELILLFARTKPRQVGTNQPTVQRVEPV